MFFAPRIVYVEVVGTCNLRCPSCPVGNYGEDRWQGSSKGVMDPALFQRILDRVRADFTADDTCVCLYSWGEPLIHPHIGTLVETVKKAGFKANLSTNLNFVRHLPDALAAGVDEIVVSLSGIRTETYETTHAGGDAATLRANLTELARQCARLPSPPAVLVNYHLYRHNLGDDLVEVEQLCRELGFSFVTNIAFYMPVEKMLGIAAGRKEADPPPSVGKLFIVPLDEQLRISASLPISARCNLRDNRLDIDVDGSVRLCCSVFEKRWNVSDSYLDTPLAEIQRRRMASHLCEACLKHGIDKIYTQLPVLDAWQAYANKVFRDAGHALAYSQGSLRRSPALPDSFYSLPGQRGSGFPFY